MFPAGVTIDPKTGAVSPNTGTYTKHLSELRSIYHDGAEFDARLARQGDAVAYTVIEYREPGADIFFGTTTMSPGRIGDEYFMTRGHFHERPDRGEIYYTQSGEGVLLMQSRQGEMRSVEMKPGVCAFIPPDWAHRSINTGEQPLIFVWCCNQDAGHDYDVIVTRGMRQIVVERNGAVAYLPNPKFAAGN